MLKHTRDIPNEGVGNNGIHVNSYIFKLLEKTNKLRYPIIGMYNVTVFFITKCIFKTIFCNQTSNY